MGGIEKAIQGVMELVEWPFLLPDLYQELGVTPNKGVLLYGPTGCGKTMLANCIAGELADKLMKHRQEELTFFKISAPELVSGLSGESESNIRNLFEQAKLSEPCIVFLDEIDSITTKRDDSSKDMGRRIVAQLISSFDEIKLGQRVVIIGATNRSDSLDPSLRSGGRFEREIPLGVPDEEGRAKILTKIISNLKVTGSFELKEIARKTSGFVGSDLVTLCREAANVAVRRIVLSNPTQFLSMGIDTLFYHLSHKGAPPSNNEMANNQQVKVTNLDNNNNGNNNNNNNNNKNNNNNNNNNKNNNNNNNNNKNNNNNNTNNNNHNNNDNNNGNNTPLSKINGNKSNQTQKIDLSKSTAKHNAPRVEISLEDDDQDIIEVENYPLKESLWENCFITMQDFFLAIPQVQPTAKREGFATIPNVSWADVGSLHEVREELSRNIVQPIKEPWRLKSVGFDAPSGVLLFGPPGCGKTLLAKAIANDCGASFISVKGPELLNKYVGESERAIRGVFERAKHSIPCIIFFDEIDALCPRRDDVQNAATSRVVNQLLIEMDGMDSRDKVFIIGATNRPDIIDPAMLRPPRFDRLLYVPLPGPEGREEILKACMRKTRVDPLVNVKELARHTERFSGADLNALVREAAINALSRTQDSVQCEEDAGKIMLTVEDFQRALESVAPSVSQKDEIHYRNLQRTIRRGGKESTAKAE